jgi:hypothetical protein
MGGIGLGKAVLSSGLLDDMYASPLLPFQLLLPPPNHSHSTCSDTVIQDVVLGLDLWPILALFSVLTLIIATFVSHTVAAVLIVPVAAQIGAGMETPHSRLLIFATSLICSAGMALPISCVSLSLSLFFCPLCVTLLTTLGLDCTVVSPFVFPLLLPTPPLFRTNLLHLSSPSHRTSKPSTSKTNSARFVPLASPSFPN